jgi:hypothetical protein
MRRATLAGLIGFRACCTAVIAAVVAWPLLYAAPSQGSTAYLGYIRQVPPEDPAERATRHREVAERRARPPLVICHRGAAAFAPENTLEAYAAAMDYGADGCEVDVRRTSDGVLVLFHDDMLDHLSNAFGTVNAFPYHALLYWKPRFVYGTADKTTRPPTFAALVALARQRRMLLHLDIKETSLDGDIATMLTEADVWDQVVAVNSTTAPVLAKDPRWKPIRFKGSGLFDKRLDMDPEAVRKQLAQAGDAIMVDDPRVASRELKRYGFAPVELRGEWRARITHQAPAAVLPLPFLATAFAPRLTNGSARARWLKLYAGDAADLAQRRDPEGASLPMTGELPSDRTSRILHRAMSAQKLAEIGLRDRWVIDWLEFQIRNRSYHKDWMYHGLDGAIAARALGDLGSVKSAPLLVETFKRVDPELTKVVDPRFAANPLGWTDFRLKMYVLPSLGKLRCAASKAFLQEYVAMPEAQAREIAPLQYAEATKALLRQDLTRPELEAMLRSTHPAVRGTAILECLDKPTRTRTAALKAVHPWALELPRARNVSNR